MRRRIRFSTHYLDRTGWTLGGLAAAIAVLQLAAGTGMAYVAGFSTFGHVLSGVEWFWLVILVAALGVSFVGYHWACRGVYEESQTRRLRPEEMRSVSVAGFGGFLAHGGSALDKYALKAAGNDDWQADVRVTALAGLEHGVLGLIGTAAATVVLVQGYRLAPMDFTLPWAVIPVPGFLTAFWLARRYSERFDARSTGWRRSVAVLLACTSLVQRLFRRAFRPPPAVWGMALFWVAEMFAAWAGMAAFGYHMSAGPLIVAVGTGMIFTRRTGPLAGAGVMILTLTASLYYCGAPFPAALAGVVAYRVLSLWLPMPFSLAQLPRLRTMGGKGEADSGADRPGSLQPAVPDRRAG